MDKVDEYLVEHQMQARDAAEVIEEFSDEISEMRGKCIDIGCGPATVTRGVFMPWLPAEATVVGVDVSKRMIDFAKINNKDEKRLSFIELNIETDALPSDQINAYDNAVSFYCLHWCQHLGYACKNIFDLLRPGGNALLVFLAYNTLYESFLAMHENPQYKPYMEDVSKYIPLFQTSKSPRASFKRMLKELGFKVIHCSVREKYFIFNNIEAMEKQTAALDPFIDRMPLEIMENYRKDLLNDLIKRKMLLANLNRSKDESKIMDMYKLIIAYIRKPNF